MDPAEYELLKGIMADPMEFIRANVSDPHSKNSQLTLIIWQVQHHLPKQFEELTIYCKVLPFNTHCPSAPFSGVVINISVCTTAHRDGSDHRMCLVLPFGNWVGGELVIYELGLVLKLHPLGFVVFSSCDFTHFNLHFSGVRGSMVLHSDRQGAKWTSNRNGWNKHIMYHK